MPFSGASLISIKQKNGDDNVTIAVLGETLIDLIQGSDGRFSAVPGGAPANVAIALRRLGTESNFIGRISGDHFGSTLRTNLESNGVGLDHVIAAEESTSLAIATLQPDGSAEYAFYLDGTADWQWHDDELPTLAGGTRALHIGSLALAIEPGATVLAAFAECVHVEKRMTISLDLNIRPSVGLDRTAEQERAHRLLLLADIIKMSTDDLEWLYPNETEGDFIGRWGSGRLIVITRGGSGSSAILDGRAPVHVRARATTVVDTVAAGDTFIAALLNQLETGDHLGTTGRLLSLDPALLRSAMEYATVAASLACERAGAEPPYPHEIQSAIAAGDLVLRATGH